MLPRLCMRAEHNGELAGLYPRSCQHWWPLVEDVFSAPVIISLQDTMMHNFLAQEEMESISIDATCQICFRLQGQAHYRAPASIRAEAAFDDASAKRRVLTVRGRTGCVLLMKPLPRETADTVAQAMLDNLPAKGLAQVKNVFSDDPSGLMWSSLQLICPALKHLCLDPVHLAIVYEYATWRRLGP
jgi:hypothetical protein